MKQEVPPTTKSKTLQPPPPVIHLPSSSLFLPSSFRLLFPLAQHNAGSAYCELELSPSRRYSPTLTQRHALTYRITATHTAAATRHRHHLKRTFTRPYPNRKQRKPLALDCIQQYQHYTELQQRTCILTESISSYYRLIEIHTQFITGIASKLAHHGAQPTPDHVDGGHVR